jgi:adenylosuccinate synthase
VRYGWFDPVLARYALRVNGGVDALFITHLDLLAKLKQWYYCTGYRDQLNIGGSLNVEIADGVMKNFHLPRYLSLAERERFTQTLKNLTPVLEPCDPDEKNVIQKIETLLEHPVFVTSNGPTAEDVHFIQVDRSSLL